MTKLTAILLLLLSMCATAQAKQALPLLNDISHIQISSPTLDGITINDSNRISQIVNFLNQYQSNWGLSKQLTSPTTITLSFFSNGEHITNIDISTTSISRLYGKHWKQSVSTNIIKKFAGSIHPAIEENLFPIYPMDENSHNNLNNWEQKLNQLSHGSDHHLVKSFIRNNNIRITHVNNHISDTGYWMNLELSLINDGDYVNTIIAAKMFLNKDHSLKSTHFLGYQLAKKTDASKRIASNLHNPRY